MILDTGLLRRVDSVAVSDSVILGGSAFGLDAPGGVQALLLDRGRGLPVGPSRAPIVPGQSCSISTIAAKELGPSTTLLGPRISGGCNCKQILRTWNGWSRLRLDDL